MWRRLLGVLVSAWLVAACASAPKSEPGLSGVERRPNAFEPEQLKLWGGVMVGASARAHAVEAVVRERERVAMHVSAAQSAASAAALEGAFVPGVLNGRRVLPQDTALRLPTDWYAPEGLSGGKRMRMAKENKRDEVEAMFEQAGLSWPPRRMVWRAFKLEHELEVWASDTDSGPLVKVGTYGICRLSGSLGPKREEGDEQVPEGFYTLDRFNSESNFHLSMRVSYPNRSDRILTTNRSAPGSAIMIHGNCASIGCLAMSDERIQELWLMARALKPTKREVELHILPGREMKALIAAAEPGLAAFWRELQAGNLRFLETRSPLDFRIDSEGHYSMR